MQEIPNREQIKLIVCDLDGTLLDDNKKITPYTKRVLQKLQELQIKICFASGRYGKMMSIYEDQIGGCDYKISSNGAEVFKGNQELHKEGIEENDIEKIISYINEHQIPAVMYKMDCVLVTTGAQVILKRLTDYESLSVKEGYPKKLNYYEVDFNQKNNEFQDVIKIVTYEEDKEKAKAYFDFVEGIDTLCAESTGYGVIGTYSYTVSKKAAVTKVMEDMAIDSSQVSVFVDYDNDLSMFACADYKIAMGNALDLLKKEATYITKSNEEDGVAWYLEQMINNTIGD